MQGMGVDGMQGHMGGEEGGGEEAPPGVEPGGAEQGGADVGAGGPGGATTGKKRRVRGRKGGRAGEEGGDGSGVVVQVVQLDPEEVERWGHGFYYINGNGIIFWVYELSVGLGALFLDLGTG